MEKRKNPLLRRRVEKYMEEYDMVAPGMTVLAGVSGGSDSMTMLHMLAAFREQMGFRLYALHVHHGIRGEEADRDEKITLETAQSLGIPCRSVKRSVPDLSEKWKKGEEETGRIIRRKAFEEEILRLGIAENFRIALAHNQDDLAETVLHHLARGTGLRGIGSMKPRSGNLIRPILCLSKKETISYLQEEKIPYGEDCTNDQDQYTRNRIRHYIIPAMEKMVNTQASRHLACAALLCGEASDYLERRGRILLDRCPKTEYGYLLDRHFMNADPLEQKYMILAALETLSSAKQDLEAVHINSVMNLAGSRSIGKRIDLPYGLEAVLVSEGTRLERRHSPEITEEPAEKKVSSSLKICVPADGSEFRGNFAGYDFRARIIPYTGQNIEEKKYTKWFDYDKIKGDLYVRQRMPGDRMAVTESGISKKLRRVMIDDKIPRELREGIPVVAQGQDILWITGFRPGARHRICPETVWILEISAQRT